MNAEIFSNWLWNFLDFTKYYTDNSVLHILMATYAIKQLKLCQRKCLTPHCTHHMHPLDVSNYLPLEISFHQKTKWWKNHARRVVTHLQVGDLFNQAYGNTVTVKNACRHISMK